MSDDMFSRRHPNSTTGIAADFRLAIERLELGEYARGIASQASVKLALPAEMARDLKVDPFEIDDIASDNLRAQKALRNDLSSDTARWSEIEERARQRACENLGISTDASLLQIINARRTLTLDVHAHALKGSIEELDWQNPEVQYAAKLCMKVIGNDNSDVISVLGTKLKQFS